MPVVEDLFLKHLNRLHECRSSAGCIHSLPHLFATFFGFQSVHKGESLCVMRGHKIAQDHRMNPMASVQHHLKDRPQENSGRVAAPGPSNKLFANSPE
jgi:hypothetical protein